MEKELSQTNNKRMSDDIRALCKAFIQAKREFKATGLDEVNAHNKSKYAKLDAIYKAVEPGLLNHGIGIWHFRDIEDGREILYTRLTHHETGQYIEDKAFLESQKPGNQEKGSTLTYMKKYAVLNLCAIHQGEDDDGQEEAKHIEAQDSPPKKPFIPDANKPSSTNQHNLIRGLMKEKKQMNLFSDEALKGMNQLDAHETIELLKKM